MSPYTERLETHAIREAKFVLRENHLPLRYWHGGYAYRTILEYMPAARLAAESLMVDARRIVRAEVLEDGKDTLF